MNAALLTQVLFDPMNHNSNQGCQVHGFPFTKYYLYNASLIQILQRALLCLKRVSSFKLKRKNK